MIWMLIGYMWMFIHRPFEVWPALGTIHIERIYVLFCMAYWLLFFPGKRWVRAAYNAAFFFFWVVLILAWIQSRYQAAGQIVVEDYLKVSVFYILVMGTVGKETDLRRLAGGYLGVVGLYMTHSLNEYRCGRHMYVMSIARMVGVDQTFNDPNTFAATIVYSLPIALAFWPDASTRRKKIILLYYVGLSILCILLTGSRSGFMGLVVLGLLCAPRLIRKRKTLFMVILCSLPLVWLALPGDLQKRFRTIVDPSAGPENAQESADSRAEFLRDGIKLWEKNPILGVGPGGFNQASGHGVPPHNLYAQTLSELGTLGGIALGWMVLSLYASGRSIRRMAKEVGAPSTLFPVRLSNAILMSVVLLLFKGYSDHNLFRYTWLWFAAFQAIALQAMRERVTLQSSVSTLEQSGPGRMCEFPEEAAVA